MQKENESLKSEKNSLNEKINSLNSALGQVEELKKILLEKDRIIDGLKDKLNNLINYDYERMIDTLKSDIQFKNEEIKKLKNISGNDLVQPLFDCENVMSIIIQSEDHRIMFPIACKNTTPFFKIEVKLYEKYPEYKGFNTYFLKSETHNRIKRFLTVEENKIESGVPIMLYKTE